MDLEERLSYLENVRDWQGLVEELEKGVASSASATEKAAFHLKLGRILEGKFLAGVKALKHFQDAYKLNPALIESLEAVDTKILLVPRRRDASPDSSPRHALQDILTHIESIIARYIPA